MIKAQRNAERANVRIFSMARNRGQHAAFVVGCQMAKGPWYLTFDADYAAAIASLPSLVETAASHDSDLVSVSRAGQRKIPGYRRLGSIVLNALVNRATKKAMQDPLSPIKLVHQSIVHQCQHFGEKRRFLAPLAISLARNPIETSIPLPQKRGRTHFDIYDLARLTLDFMLNFFPRIFPRLLVWSLLGIVLSSLAGAGYLIMRIMGFIEANVIFQVLDFAFLFMCLNALSLAIIGEYHLRAYTLISESSPYEATEIKISPEVIS